MELASELINVDDQLVAISLHNKTPRAARAASMLDSQNKIDKPEAFEMSCWPFNQRHGLFCARLAICSALVLTTSKSNAQTIVLNTLGPQGDSGIDVIQPGHVTTLEWAQSIPFSDVSLFAGLASYGTSGTGWATLGLGSTQIASTGFDFPGSWGARVGLFDGLDLLPGTYSLTIGSFTGSDDGWEMPIDNMVETADNVTYLGSFGWYGNLYRPVDCLIVSVPEPSTSSLIGFGLVVVGVWLQRRGLGGKVVANPVVVG